MNPVSRVAVFALATMACVSLHAIEKHLSLAAEALVFLVLSPPAPNVPHQSTPGVQPASLSMPRGQKSSSDAPPMVMDGGDAESPARFEAGGLKLPDGTVLQIVEDREARTYVYIVRDEHGISVTAWAKTDAPSESPCESDGLRMARMEDEK